MQKINIGFCLEMWTTILISLFLKIKYILLSKSNVSFVLSSSKSWKLISIDWYGLSSFFLQIDKSYVLLRRFWIFKPFLQCGHLSTVFFVINHCHSFSKSFFLINQSNKRQTTLFFKFFKKYDVSVFRRSYYQVFTD